MEVAHAKKQERISAAKRQRSKEVSSGSPERFLPVSKHLSLRDGLERVSLRREVAHSSMTSSALFSASTRRAVTKCSSVIKRHRSKEVSGGTRSESSRYPSTSRGVVRSNAFRCGSRWRGRMASSAILGAPTRRAIP